MFWPFLSRRERLRRQAADWVARLNGPCTGRDRAEFEQWYWASPDHAAAYDRLSALFSAAANIQRPAETVVRHRPQFRAVHYAVAAVACVLLIGAILLLVRPVSPGAAGSDQIATFSAPTDAGRRIVLVDGSEVLLSPASILEVAIGQDQRRLRLVRGEGRFTVRHEARPFVVTADGTEVTARGTQFVIRLAGGRTLVALIEGRVDVTHHASGEGPGGRRVTSLRAGQRLMVPTAQSSTVAGAPTSPHLAAESPPAMLQFDETPLGEAVARVNRHGRPEIRLEDASLGQLRVSGAYRAGDTRGFAESIAAAFRLVVERGEDGSLLLRRRPGG